jgi:hypothetical protein
MTQMVPRDDSLLIDFVSFSLKSFSSTGKASGTCAALMQED